MKANMPDATIILLRTGSLADLLTSFVAHNTVHRHKLLNQGISKEDAEATILKALIPNELKGELGNYTWRVPQDDDILKASLDSLRDKHVIIQVQ